MTSDSAFSLSRHASGAVFLKVGSWEALGARAVFSTRQGGTSAPPFESLNLGSRPGEDDEAVHRNRLRFFQAVGFAPFEKWICPQRHTANVVCVDDLDECSDSLRLARPATTDGLSTSRRRVALFTVHADCVPVYLFDPERMAICLAHAGWRGTCLRMAEAAVAHMRDRFGSDPSVCLAAIGPSVGSCCYEVDRPVLEKLSETYRDLEGLVFPSGSKWLLNLKEANRRCLTEAGVPEENIAVSEHCTRCEGDLFFSHRRQGLHAGRMLAGLGLV